MATGADAGAEPFRVVILGANFGGLEAARALARAPVEITLVDRQNHHLFKPLLYQVAQLPSHPATSRGRCAPCSAASATCRC
jgi:NADH:ubiquinone reductase (H+-translocating)